MIPLKESTKDRLETHTETLSAQNHPIAVRHQGLSTSARVNCDLLEPSDVGKPRLSFLHLVFWIPVKD